MSRTLGQQRANYCLEKLKLLTCSRADFKTFSAGLPAMILQNGFGQTLAFLLAKATDGKKLEFKKDDKHYVAFQIISEWLERQNLLSGQSEREKVFQISEMKQEKYLQAQTETLAMLEWLKRFANAALFGEQT